MDIIKSPVPYMEIKKKSIQKSFKLPLVVIMINKTITY